MVFAVELPSPHGATTLQWSRWTEFADLALAGREMEARGGQAWQPPLSPTLLPSSLRPASSLRPTNGTSAWLCLPQPQTPAKLAGLAAFALKRWVPFWVCLKPHGSHPPHIPHHTPPLRSGWQAFRQAAVLSRGSLLDQGGQGAWDESLPFSLCGKGWNAIITRLPIK